MQIALETLVLLMVGWVYTVKHEPLLILRTWLVVVIISISSERCQIFRSACGTQYQSECGLKSSTELGKFFALLP